MRWVIVSVLVVIALVIGVSLGPSLTPFDAYNTYWDGYSTAASICLRPVYSLSSIGNAGSVFIVPEVALPRSEVTQLLSFVSDGGKLVIMGGPEANTLLRELGLGSRFTNLVIRDPVLNAINDMFPLAIVINTTILPMRATVIALDNATVIDINDPGAVVLAQTSPFSVAGNSTGPFPVAVAIPVGRGYVILISTPSVFMNSMIGYADNAEFLRGLCGGEAVYLESALAPNNAQLIIRYYLITAYSAMLNYPISYVLIVAPVLISSIVLLIRGRGTR